MLKPEGESKQTALVLLILIAAFAVSYLLFMLAVKLFGIILILIGLGLLIWFPSIPRYQPGKFVDTAIIVGLLFVIVGALIAIFW